MNFETSASKVKLFKHPLHIQEIFKLYALYKQGVEGDCPDEQVRLLSMDSTSTRNKLKIKYWAKLKGTDEYHARIEYCEYVDELIQKYGLL